MNPRQNLYHKGAVASLLALVALCVAWEWLLAPLQPGGSWMILKVLPLLPAVRGVFRRDVYTLQWSSMMVLLFFIEGVVRGFSDRLPLSAALGWIEALLVCVYFVCAVLYLSPIKKAAKRQAREAADQAAHQTGQP